MSSRILLFILDKILIVIVLNMPLIFKLYQNKFSLQIDIKIDIACDPKIKKIKKNSFCSSLFSPPNSQCKSLIVAIMLPDLRSASRKWP